MAGKNGAGRRKSYSMQKGILQTLSPIKFKRSFIILQMSQTRLKESDPNKNEQEGGRVEAHTKPSEPSTKPFKAVRLKERVPSIDINEMEVNKSETGGTQSKPIIEPMAYPHRPMQDPKPILKKPSTARAQNTLGDDLSY